MAEWKPPELTPAQKSAAELTAISKPTPGQERAAEQATSFANQEAFSGRVRASMKEQSALSIDKIKSPESLQEDIQIAKRTKMRRDMEKWAAGEPLAEEDARRVQEFVEDPGKAVEWAERKSKVGRDSTGTLYVDGKAVEKTAPESGAASPTKPTGLKSKFYEPPKEGPSQSAGVRIAGSVLAGGVFGGLAGAATGLVTGAADSALKNATGKDMGEHMVSAAKTIAGKEEKPKSPPPKSRPPKGPGM